MVRARNKFILLLMVLTVVVSALSFLRWALIGREVPLDKRIEKELKILAYSTFISSSGPGPELIQKFKKECDCKVTVVTAGDAGLLLERLKLTQSKAGFDVVIGLDQLSKQKAIEGWAWMPVELDAEPKVLFEEDVLKDFDPRFIPFDYSPMTFIYRKGEIEPPQSLEDLKLPRFKNALSIQDPRTSSPGLQFLAWIQESYGANSLEYLKAFKPSVHSVSPSWALSYGLFKKGQSKMVFSYVTSLAYHWAIEKDKSYMGVEFPQGHPVQVEFAAVPTGCTQCELGQAFVKSMLTPEAQTSIAQNNYMFPSVKLNDGLEIFDGLPKLKTLGLSKESTKLEAWSQAFD